MKRRAYEILEVAAPGDRASRAFDVLIMSLIALNVVALTLETVDSIHAKAPWLFRTIEVVSVTIFTVEYLLRIWSCTSSPTYRSPFLGRLRFALTFLALVDLTAILPFYLPFLGIDLRSVCVPPRTSWQCGC